MSDKPEKTDTERLDFIQGLNDPILEIGRMKGCRCSGCNGWTLREQFSGKRAYSEDGVRGAIDALMNGDVEDYKE